MIFVVIFGVFALVVLDQLGLLPDTVHRSLGRIEATFVPASSVPAYLEKFEGEWDVSMTPGDSPQGIDCPAQAGSVRIHDGVLSGALGSFGHQMTLAATIDESGHLSGTLDMGQRTGSWSGSAANGEGSGTWSDDLDCMGTLTLSKDEAVIDPIAGIAASIGGSATLMRGQVSRALLPKEPLYSGDTIVVTSGTVSLTLGTLPNQTSVNLSKGESYTVK